MLGSPPPILFPLTLVSTPRVISGRLKYGIHRPGETQAWNQPGSPGGSSIASRATIKVCLASYLGIRPLSLLTAVRPPPGLVKLKHGITPTPLSGETQAWNPSDLVGTSISPPRIQYWFGIATWRSRIQYWLVIATRRTGNPILA